MVDALLVALGSLVAIVVASDRAVDGGRRLARRAGVSDLAVGLTVTSIGTSLPELATTVSGAVEAHGEAVAAADVAAGNLLGSNLFLLGGLLGVTGLVRGFAVDVGELRRDGAALAMATLAAMAAAADGHVGRVEAGVLLLVFAAWMGALVVAERARRAAPVTPADAEEAVSDLLERAHEGAPARARPVARDVLELVGGLAMVVVGAAILVDRGAALAEALGVPGAVVGMWVGVGTSLPEVVVSLQSARRGAADVAFGNVLGSAIVNLTLCLAAGAMAVPLAVSATPLDAAFLVLTTATALLLLADHRELTRSEGAVLVLLFVAYATLRSVGG